jgi:hypothetical protein
MVAANAPEAAINAAIAIVILQRCIIVFIGHSWVLDG